MDYSSGHGLYAQGSSPFSWTKVNDCVFANNALNGCQLYSALDANINNYQMTGNLFLRNGNGVPGGVEFVEGSGSGCTNLVFKNNVMLGNASDSATFGGSATLLVIADIEQNCFYNLPVNFYSFTGLTMLSNLVDNANSFLLVQSNYFGAVWDYNNYYFSSPTPVTMDFYPSGGAAYLTHAQWVAYSGFDVHSTVAATLTNPSVIVRSNQWEVGRGSITIVNPRSNGVVNVDLSGIGLAKGQTYVIHPVQDFFGYCLTNTYVGTPVAIPMTNWHCYTPMSLVNAITNQVWLTNVNGESIVNSNYSTMIPIVANGGLISTFPAFGAFVVVPIPLVLLAPPTALIIYTNKHVNP